MSSSTTMRPTTCISSTAARTHILLTATRTHVSSSQCDLFVFHRFPLFCFLFLCSLSFIVSSGPVRSSLLSQIWATGNRNWLPAAKILINRNRTAVNRFFAVVNRSRTGFGPNRSLTGLQPVFCCTVTIYNRRCSLQHVCYQDSTW